MSSQPHRRVLVLPLPPLLGPPPPPILGLSIPIISAVTHVMLVAAARHRLRLLPLSLPTSFLIKKPAVLPGTV
jgi:hypothetical protein